MVTDFKEQNDYASFGYGDLVEIRVFRNNQLVVGRGIVERQVKPHEYRIMDQKNDKRVIGVFHAKNMVALKKKG